MIHVRAGRLCHIFQSAAAFQPFNALAINCVCTHENETQVVYDVVVRLLLLLLSLLSIFCLKTPK